VVEVGSTGISASGSKKVFWLGRLKITKHPPRTTRAGNLGQKIVVEKGLRRAVIDVLYVFEEAGVSRVLRIAQGNKTVFVEVNGLLMRLIEESFTRDLPEYLYRKAVK